MTWIKETGYQHARELSAVFVHLDEDARRFLLRSSSSVNPLGFFVDIFTDGCEPFVVPKDIDDFIIP